MEDRVQGRAAFLGSMSLLVFSALTTVALIGWFMRSDEAITWKSLIAMGCVVLGGATSAMLWRTPSRTHALMGIGVMLFSLLRIGMPDDWTWVSFALVAVTFILLMPLVHAAIVLRDDGV